ncbi:hypothetical protein Tco_0525444 [Tanacetum coccineum]
MLLNMDQLEKKIDKEEFQEIGSMAAFKVLKTQFQMFIKSRIYLDDEYVTTKEKVDTSKALEHSLINIKGLDISLKARNTSSNFTRIEEDADDADIKTRLRWVPTGKIFTLSTNKVDSEPTNGSNEDITNQYECEQTLDVSAGTLNLSASTSFNPKKEGLRVCSELRIYDHNNEPSSSKLVPKVVPPADKTATSRQELELLFHHHITMLRLQLRPRTTKESVRFSALILKVRREDF